MKTENELAESVSLRIKDQFDDAVDVRTWGGPQAILEIVPKGVHKALGLSVIADSLSLDRQDIIALVMNTTIWRCWIMRVGALLANGTQQLKSIANDVTDKTNAKMAWSITWKIFRSIKKPMQDVRISFFASIFKSKCFINDFFGFWNRFINKEYFIPGQERKDRPDFSLKIRFSLAMVFKHL